MKIWPMLLLAGYALTVHLSVSYGYPLAAVLALAALLLLGLARAVAVRDRGSLMFIAIYALATLLMLRFAGVYGMLFLPPVALNLAAGLFFMRGLLPGQTDIITRVALHVRPQRSARVLRYTRRVSWAWTLFCLGLTLLSAVLAIAAPIEIWSLFTNCINYLLLGAFFGAEIALRHIILRGEPTTSLRDTLRAMSHIDFRRMFLT